MNPEKIGGYDIQRELGRGAMGVVYHAHDKGIDRAVAIKVIKIDSGSSARESAELRQRLIREASVAGKISHPGIVTVYQLGEEDGNIFIVMEYVEGASLDKLLAERKGPDTAWALDILSQIAVALDYAHKTSVVHRDIKPANILVRGDGRVKIADFGIAKMTAGTTTGLTAVGASVGSPAYMSPEQVQATQIDGRSDQFALGTIAFLMLAGRMPFKGSTMHSVMYQIVTADPFEPQEGDVPLSPDVRVVLSRALAKNPKDRYKDCASFLHDLTAAVNGQELTQTPGHGGLGTGAAAPPAIPVAAIPIQTPPEMPVHAPPPVNQYSGQQPAAQPWEMQTAPVVEKKSSMLGPILGILFLMVLLAGGAYYWYTRTCCAAPAGPTPAEPKQAQTTPVPAPQPTPVSQTAPTPAPAEPSKPGAPSNPGSKPAAAPAAPTGATPLLTAVAQGHVDQVRTLLDGGADVNQAGSDGVTPLMSAIAHDHIDAAQVLIDHGADVNLQDANLNTALMVAATTSPEIQDPTPLLRLLLSHGAKRGMKDAKGKIAFQRAADSKNAAAIKVLR